jgi:hypothetical protein
MSVYALSLPECYRLAKVRQFERSSQCAVA